MTYKACINQLETTCESAGKSAFVVKYVTVELSGLSATDFYLQMNEDMPESLAQQVQEVIYAYIEKDIPIDYLLGYRYFYGYKFYVNEHVLIPRVETEELVDNILLLIQEKPELNIIDLGTGSGCIGLTIKKELPKHQLTLTDISEDALQLVNKNMQALNIDVTTIKSDWFKNVQGIFDVIVSNPPYIPDDEEVGDTVHNEPEVALYGGQQGLNHYENILKNIHPYMHEKTLIAFEHGYQQKDAIQRLIKKYLPHVDVVTLKDLQGRERMTFASQDNTYLRALKGE